MNFLQLVNEISQMHQESIPQWKQDGVIIEQTDLNKLIQENHAFNYQLWHAEDKARRDDAGFEWVYQAKREIDRCNQQRNNRMEAIDIWLFERIKPSADKACPVHSETPGMMIDRLSILSLKVYHMAFEAQRTDAPLEQQQVCKKKWHILTLQRQQLQQCLHQLLDECREHKRTFQLYHQFKMYNDPALNPELYRN
jgi:hypothetical protein